MTMVVVVDGDAPGSTGSACAAALTRLAPGLSTRVVSARARSGPGDIEGADGAVIVGAGFGDARAGWSPVAIGLIEALFAAGAPVLGLGWGLHIAATALGGRVREHRQGGSLGLARHLRLTEAGRAHPLHDGRAASFDAPALSAVELEEAPRGAVVTAVDERGVAEAMAYEADGARFWGVQYRPDLSPAQACRLVSAIGPDPARFGDRPAIERLADAFDAIEADPVAAAPLAWRYGVGAHLWGFEARTAELANWLRGPVGARLGPQATDAAGMGAAAR